MRIDPLEGKALEAVRDIPDQCDLIIFEGAIRSSKTISSLLLWVEYVVKGPEGKLAMCGRTETAVINNLLLPLQEILGRNRVVINRGTGTATILGRTILLFGANDEQARTKVQGLTLAGAYLDEGANVPESFFNMLYSRLSVAGARLYVTCNPEGPKHWLHVKWLQRYRVWLDRDGKRHEHKGEDRLELYRVTFLLDDNKALQRDNPAFFRRLMTAYAKGSVFHRRFILSEWASAEGAVYAGWDEEHMTVQRSQLPPIERVLMASLDYGTVHRTRGYLLGIVRVPFHDGWPDWTATMSPGAERIPVLVILDEFAPGTGTVGQHADQYEAWLARCVEEFGRPEWIAVDPAAATFKIELFNRGRDDVMNAHNSVIPGIQLVDSVMTARRLYVVADRCPHLVDRIPGYMYDSKATDRGETKVVKEDDDEADALRYVVVTSRSEWAEVVPIAYTPGGLDAVA